MELGRENPGNPQRRFLHDRARPQTLAPRQRRLRAARRSVARTCGPASIPASRRTQFPSATSPTACTFLPGWRRRCSGFTTATWEPAGRSTAPIPQSGKESKTWTTANCGKPIFSLKSRLLEFVRHRVVEQAERRDESPEMLQRLGRVLSPDALTIGFARRFATYKRADLILADIEKLTSHGERSQAPGAVRFRRQGASRATNPARRCCSRSPS